MKLELKKFGEILTSRPAGRESWLAIRPYVLDGKKRGEKMKVDFSGVQVLAPSWADEFISALIKEYSGEVVLLPSDNASVKASLEFVDKKTM